MRMSHLGLGSPRWEDAFAQRQKDGSLKEARLHLVVRDGSRVWYVDFSCFHPFASPVTERAKRGRGNGGSFVRGNRWSLALREADKHDTYVTSRDGRRLVDGSLVPLIANSFAAVGKEAEAFFQVLHGVAKKRSRQVSGGSLLSFVQSIVTFYTAQHVLAAFHAG